MEIKTAEKNDLATVRQIVMDTINAVYPHYYPKGAVDFFLAHHCDENIMKDISSGDVFILCDDSDTPVGTVTTAGNELNRLFVLPEYQGRGFGRELMNFAENRIFGVYERIVISASLPAKQIYLGRGYISTGFHSIPCEGGDFLCYDEMKKETSL